MWAWLARWLFGIEPRARRRILPTASPRATMGEFVKGHCLGCGSRLRRLQHDPIWGMTCSNPNCGSNHIAARDQDAAAGIDYRDSTYFDTNP